MKYIVHIKFPVDISHADINRAQTDLAKALGSDYLVVATSDNIEMIVHPKFVYRIALFFHKTKESIYKFYNWICRPVM